MTSLDMTFTLFRAWPRSVTIATSTKRDTRALPSGRTPIVKLPGTDFAPSLAASITPLARPPVNNTHP